MSTAFEQSNKIHLFIKLVRGEPSENKWRLRKAMLMSISYASTFGGAGTLIGSGAPLAFKGILEE